MSTIPGRGVAIGLGKEVTRGTAVAPSVWYPHLSLDADDQIELAENESVLGNRASMSGADVSEKYAELSLEAKVRERAYGYILLGLFGQVTTTQVAGQTGVYKHEFTPTINAAIQSLTAVENTQNGVRAYPMAVVDSHELSVSTGEYVKFTADLIARASQAATATPAFTEEGEFVGRNVTIKRAANVAGLAGATALANVSEVSANMSNNADRFVPLGTYDPDLYAMDFDVDGSFTLLWNDRVHTDLMLAGTPQAIQIAIVNTGKTIGTSTNPSLTFTFPRVYMTETPRSLDPSNLVTQEISFNGHFDFTTGNNLSATLINTQPSY